MLASKTKRHLIITPMKGISSMIDLQNFTPMRNVVDPQGNVMVHKTYGFVLTKTMSYEDLLTNEVTKWVTLASRMQALDFPTKTIVNKDLSTRTVVLSFYMTPVAVHSVFTTITRTLIFTW